MNPYVTIPIIPREKLTLKETRRLRPEALATLASPCTVLEYLTYISEMMDNDETSSTILVK